VDSPRNKPESWALQKNCFVRPFLRHSCGSVLWDRSQCRVCFLWRPCFIHTQIRAIPTYNSSISLRPRNASGEIGHNGLRSTPACMYAHHWLRSFWPGHLRFWKEMYRAVACVLYHGRHGSGQDGRSDDMCMGRSACRR
jgi:hypothetical protein